MQGSGQNKICISLPSGLKLSPKQHTEIQAALYSILKRRLQRKEQRQTKASKLPSNEQKVLESAYAREEKAKQAAQLDQFRREAAQERTRELLALESNIKEDIFKNSDLLLNILDRRIEGQEAKTNKTLKKLYKKIVPSPIQSPIQSPIPSPTLFEYMPHQYQQYDEAIGRHPIPIYDIEREIENAARRVGYTDEELEELLNQRESPKGSGLIRALRNHYIGSKGPFGGAKGLEDRSMKQSSDLLYDTDIVKYLHPLYKRGFLGVFSANNLANQPIQSLRKQGSMIINLDPTVDHYNKPLPGSHWVALYWDLHPIPTDPASTNSPDPQYQTIPIDAPFRGIYYYDSFGRPPPEQVANNILKLIHKIEIKYPGMHTRTLLMLTHNTHQHQDIRSEACGWFAMMFLKSMYQHADEYQWNLSNISDMEHEMRQFQVQS